MMDKYRQTITSKSLGFASTGLCLALVIGCQEEANRVYPAAGKVVFSDGSPAKFGIIEFRSLSAEPIVARGKIEPSGSFQVKTSGQPGLVAGTHQVIILQVIGDPASRRKIIHRHGREVARKYRSYETSDLTVEVSAEGDNDFTLEVDAN